MSYLKTDKHPIMKIEQVTTSRIDQVDFENISFGDLFTDHMFVCDYENGAWKEPTIVPYQPMSISPSARVFHYGQAVFEGMKAYKDDYDKVWLFRPDENFKRFNKSSKRLAIPEFPEEYFFEGLAKLLQMDTDWIQKGMGNSLYIRPFVFATQASVQASHSAEYRFMIICAPAQSYYSEADVRVKIADHYSRAANGGVGSAKAAGNYAAQFYPSNLAKEEGFQQIIWTDAAEHKFLEEAGTMNIFFRIGNQLITAPTNDRILDGVTRKSLIALAKKSGIDIQVRPFSVDELLESANSGTLLEIFGSGTAVVVNPIKGFGYKDYRYDVPDIEDSFALKLKEQLIAIQYNLAEDPFQWRFPV